MQNKAHTDTEGFTVACRTWICCDWLYFHQAKPLSYKVAGIVRYLCSNELSVYIVLGKRMLGTAARPLLVAALTPVETVHHRGLHRKTNDVASTAGRVSS